MTDENIIYVQYDDDDDENLKAKMIKLQVIENIDTLPIKFDHM